MDKIKCVQCGKMIASDSRFCPECGAEQTKFCPGCGGKIVLGDKTCSQCGRDVSNLFAIEKEKPEVKPYTEPQRTVYKKICPKCGAELSPKTITEETNWSGCLIAIIAFAIILAALFLAFMIGKVLGILVAVIGLIVLFRKKKTQNNVYLSCSNCGYTQKLYDDISHLS